MPSAAMAHSPKYLRIWKANPVKHPDGTWDSYKGGVNVVFALEHDLQSKFLSLVAQDLQATVTLSKLNSTK